jgi:hypothetical protein
MSNSNQWKKNKAGDNVVVPSKDLVTVLRENFPVHLLTQGQRDILSDSKQEWCATDTLRIADFILKSDAKWAKKLRAPVKALVDAHKDYVSKDALEVELDFDSISGPAIAEYRLSSSIFRRTVIRKKLSVGETSLDLAPKVLEDFVSGFNQRSRNFKIKLKE